MPALYESLEYVTGGPCLQGRCSWPRRTIATTRSSPASWAGPGCCEPAPWPRHLRHEADGQARSAGAKPRGCKNISRSRGEQVLLEEIRYFFYITTLTGESAEQVVELANERCDQETVTGQLKSGINALRVPLYDLVSNSDGPHCC
jgi:hypothetical protein